MLVSFVMWECVYCFVRLCVRMLVLCIIVAANVHLLYGNVLTREIEIFSLSHLSLPGAAILSLIEY